jgi:hypothetical protein
VRRKNVLVTDVLSISPLNLEFRRVLVGNHFKIWLQLVTELMEVTLSTAEDMFSWRLTDTESFTVKSMYADLMDGQIVFLWKYIWKLKVPRKINIFMWFLHQKVLLTKDNLIKHN